MAITDRGCVSHLSKLKSFILDATYFWNRKIFQMHLIQIIIQVELFTIKLCVFVFLGFLDQSRLQVQSG
jgi:hypothetical protein